MGEAFIVRKGGGVVDATPAPTISFVSKTEDSVTFTITNNSLKARDITYGLTTPPTTTTINLAGGATSANQTISDITELVITIYAQTEDSAITEFRVRFEFLIDPADFNPQLWLDASDASTITESSGSVSQWNNKGSLGNFTQGTGASQPTTGVTTLNGLNVLDFASDFLTAANSAEWKILHDGTIHEIFIVAKMGTTVNPGLLFGVIGNDQFGSNILGMGIGFNDDSADNTIFYRNRRPSPTDNPAGLDANEYVVGNQFNILSLFGDPSNATAANRAELRRNGGNLVNNNTATEAVSTSNPTNALQIGAAGGNSFSMTGSIAEIIIITGANATPTNRTSIINYLGNKWGITV